jgi:hypothetical protein
MNQWIILTILIAFIVGYTLYQNNKKFFKEAFGMYEDDSRTIRYGDIITIWSPSVNKFLQADPTVGNKMITYPMGKLNLSNSLISSEDIPSSMDWVQYMIIDAKDPGDIGNTSPVKYGSPVYLKTVHLQDGKFLPTYIAPNKNNSVYMSAERYEGNPQKMEQQLILESANGLQGSEIYYGDMIVIKTWKPDMSYIHVSRMNDVILSSSSAVTRNFYLCDRFGQGRNIDWARRSTTQQSSTNNNLFSQFAIDGNLLTYSSTAKEKSPWWEVILPKDVLISRITLSNIHDSTQSQLSNFDIKIVDFDDTPIDSKTFDGSIKRNYSWDNVNQIARKVRIVLNRNDSLNIADIRVYGQAVNYSVLLNEEMSKNLLSSEHFDTTHIVSFKHRTLPKVSKDMTIMFLLELDKLPTETSNIFIKSKDIEDNRTPNLLIYPPKLNANYSTLQYIVSTDAGNNEMGENFMINYNVVPNKKIHFTAIHDGGLNKLNGWIPCRFTSKSSKYNTGTYLCNFMTREFYKLIIETSAVFKNEYVIDLDDPDNYGFNIKGLYNDDMSIPKINIYINGLLNTTYQLKSAVKNNIYSLNIGAFKKYPGFEGTMSFLKFSNRVIPQEYIQKESQILTGKISIILLSDTTRVAVGSSVKVDPNYLPEINSNKPEYTFHLWINSQRPITGTGNDEAIVQYGEEGIFFHSSNNTLFTKTNSGENGVDNTSVGINVDQWVHIAYIVKNNNAGLYINGKQVGSKGLGIKDVKTNSFAIINIGGFNGYVASAQFCNYGLSDKDLKNILNTGPINEAIDKVRQSFTSAGCTADPIDVSNPYVDNYNSSWINYAGKNDTGSLVQSITDFKKLADAGITSGDVIKLKLAEKCYGKSNVLSQVELNRNKELLKNGGKDSIKCLPKAPFTCKKSNINDFDITTHKNFSKYIQKSKIREPPTPINTITQIPPDPEKYISIDFVNSNFVEKSKVSASAEYTTMKSKIDEMKKQISEMNKMKDLVAKCQASMDKTDKINKSITDVKAITTINPQNIGIKQQLEKLHKEKTHTYAQLTKDSGKLLDKMSLVQMINSKAAQHKDYEFLHKKNIELANLSKRTDINNLLKTDRIIPGGNASIRNSKITVKADGKNWLEPQKIDLKKIQKMVHADFVDIEKKLDMINKKIDVSKMSDLDAAKLKDKISQLKQNKITCNKP